MLVTLGGVKGSRLKRSPKSNLPINSDLHQLSDRTGNLKNGLCRFKIQFRKNDTHFLVHRRKFRVLFFKEPIDGHTRTQILSELKDLRNVSDLLSILEMGVGFLSMAGGDPETKICDYLRNVLRLGDGKSNLKSKKVGNISSSYVFLEGTVTNPAI